jgi:hypothetical protein
MTMVQNASTDAEIARMKTWRTVAIALAVISFLTLVYGFGMKWEALYQVAAGLVAYACIEWQRRCGQRIKVLSGAADRG